MSKICLGKIGFSNILNTYYCFMLHLSRPPLFTYPHFAHLKTKTKTGSFFNVFSLLSQFSKNCFKLPINTTKHTKRPHAMSRICLEQYSSLITKLITQLKNSSGDGRGKKANGY